LKAIFGDDWHEVASDPQVLESIKKGRIPGGSYQRMKDGKKMYINRGMEYYTPDYKFHPRNDLAQKPGYYLFDETGTDYINPISYDPKVPTDLRDYQYEPLMTRDEAKKTMENFIKSLYGE